MDFQQQVLERSYEIPVVVDFWAPWCGPCRILGPVIEQLAGEQSGRWELVKLNTEEEPGIAQDYQIRSIPNVKLFHRGRVVAEFAGALGKTAIEKWLDEHLPDERQDQVHALLEQLEAGEDAAAQLLSFFDAQPDLLDGRLPLAQHLLFTEPAKALQVVAPIPMHHPLHEAAEDIRTLASLLELQPETNASPAAPLMQEAAAAARSQDLETAIQKIIAATTADRQFHDELPRKAAIALFRTLGPHHPLTKNYRWRFDMALY